MGADLLGYHTMIPDKLTAKEKKILKKHLDDFEKLLKSKNFAQKLAKETSANDPLLSQLNSLSPLMVDDMSNRITYDEENFEQLEELIEEILGLIPDARKFIDTLNFGGERDLSSRIYTILGRKFHSIFAGEMSWGDEPEGEGYELFKNLDRVGLLSKIEEITIPSQPLSVQFIKGD